MARMKRRARQWHLKGSFALAVLFAVGLFVSGAFGDVSPLTFSTSGSASWTSRVKRTATRPADAFLANPRV